MNLPPEIRLMIYELALQDTIATAMSAGLYIPFPKYAVYLGALALTHTTSKIRKESRDVMHAIAHS